jgi:hypothetical protein
MTPFPSEEKGLAPQRNVNARVRDLGVHRWRCLPLNHTLFNPLTCDFVTPELLSAGCMRDASAQRPGNLRGEAVVGGDALAAKAASQWCAVVRPGPNKRCCALGARPAPRGPVCSRSCSALECRSHMRSRRAVD